MATTLIPDPPGVQEIALREALEERYFNYALSTIMHRALPDARAALKPVHRRTLYSMPLSRPPSRTPLNESAKIVRDSEATLPPQDRPAAYQRVERTRTD